MVNRQIICTDANIWLKQNKDIKVIITSLPDMDEIGQDYNGWVKWIETTSNNLIESLHEDGIIFFFQSPRRTDGMIIDKKSLLTPHFLSREYYNVMNKIVLRQKINTVNFVRSGYIDLFAFSKTLKSGNVTPDVIENGKILYQNSMGENAIKVCLDYLKRKDIKETIVDPFCGKGSVLTVSNDYGYDTIGIDIDKDMIKYCKSNYNNNSNKLFV